MLRLLHCYHLHLLLSLSVYLINIDFGSSEFCFSTNYPICFLRDGLTWSWRAKSSGMSVKKILVTKYFKSEDYSSFKSSVKVRCRIEVMIMSSSHKIYRYISTVNRDWQPHTACINYIDVYLDISSELFNIYLFYLTTAAWMLNVDLYNKVVR